MMHVLHSPNLVWWVMFAMLTTMVSGKPAGWRAWVILVCWLVVLLVLVLLKGALR